MATSRTGPANPGRCSWQEKSKGCRDTHLELFVGFDDENYDGTAHLIPVQS